MDSTRATAIDRVAARRWRGRHNRNTMATYGTTAMEGAMAMDELLGVENGANCGDIIAKAV